MAAMITAIGCVCNRRDNEYNASANCKHYNFQQSLPYEQKNINTPNDNHPLLSLCSG